MFSDSIVKELKSEKEEEKDNTDEGRQWQSLIVKDEKLGES